MSKKNPAPLGNASEFIFYQSEDGTSRIQVRLENETVWLTQRQLADLYQLNVNTVSRHIKVIFDEGELQQQATVRQYRIVAPEAARTVERLTNHYNLDMVLAVGYRVRSARGTQFRRWATERLREYLVKGFVLDDERLKEGRNLGTDYFDELLARIRDIRASEKRFYQKLRDIFKLAMDYDPNAENTQRFFQVIQNKLHWAATGMTAAEIIAERADAAQPNMGLTNWKGGIVRQSDVTTAKNYLNPEEIDHLNRIVTMYLDFAELQARSRNALYMKDWQEKLDAFLQFNQQEILTHAGRVQMEVAKQLALEQYAAFNTARLKQEAEQEAIADDAFDAAAKRLAGKGKKA